MPPIRRNKNDRQKARKAPAAKVRTFACTIHYASEAGETPKEVAAKFRDQLRSSAWIGKFVFNVERSPTATRNAEATERCLNKVLTEIHNEGELTVADTDSLKEVRELREAITRFRGHVHVQLCITLSGDPERCVQVANRLNKWRKEGFANIRGVHVGIAHSRETAERYSSKNDDTVLAGPYGNHGKFRLHDVVNYHHEGNQLRAWQKNLLALMQAATTSKHGKMMQRKVWVIVDELGNRGKTVLTLQARKVPGIHCVMMPAKIDDKAIQSLVGIFRKANTEIDSTPHMWSRTPEGDALPVGYNVYISDVARALAAPYQSNPALDAMEDEGRDAARHRGRWIDGRRESSLAFASFAEMACNGLAQDFRYSFSEEATRPGSMFVFTNAEIPSDALSYDRVCKLRLVGNVDETYIKVDNDNAKKIVDYCLEQGIFHDVDCMVPLNVDDDDDPLFRNLPADFVATDVLAVEAERARAEDNKEVHDEEMEEAVEGGVAEENDDGTVVINDRSNHEKLKRLVDVARRRLEGKPDQGDEDHDVINLADVPETPEDDVRVTVDEPIVIDDDTNGEFSSDDEGEYPQFRQDDLFSHSDLEDNDSQDLPAANLHNNDGDSFEAHNGIPLATYFKPGVNALD